MFKKIGIGIILIAIGIYVGTWIDKSGVSALKSHTWLDFGDYVTVDSSGWIHFKDESKMPKEAGTYAIFSYHGKIDPEHVYMQDVLLFQGALTVVNSTTLYRIPVKSNDNGIIIAKDDVYEIIITESNLTLSDQKGEMYLADYMKFFD